MLIKAYSSYTVVDVVDGMQWQGNFAVAPENPQLSWAYYNTTEKQSYIYDGTQWVVFAKDGSKGNGISEKLQQYYESTSDIRVEDGQWLDYFPESWTGETYIWTRTKEVWTEQNEYGEYITTYTSPQLMSRIDMATIAAQKAGQTLTEWCVDKDVSIIDGSTIATGTITAKQVDTNSIVATDHGTIAGWQITSDAIYSNPSGVVSGMASVNAILEYGGLHFEFNSDGSSYCVAGYDDDKNAYRRKELVFTAMSDGGEMSGKVAFDGIIESIEIYACDDGYEQFAFENVVTTITDSGFTITGDHLHGPYTGDVVITAYIEYYQKWEPRIPNFYHGLPVTEIGNGAFYNCKSLTSVAIGSNVTEIGSYAFDTCINLTSIVMFGNVEHIGAEVFIKCNKLSDIYYYGNQSMWENIEMGINDLTKVNIHYLWEFTQELDYEEVDDQGVAITGLTDFSGSDVILSSGETTYGFITSIKASAFTGATFSTIVISRSVTKIGENAFLACNNLASVHFEGTPEEWATIEIAGGNSALINAKIYFKEDGEQLYLSSLVNPDDFSQPRFFAGYAPRDNTYIPTSVNDAKFVVLEDGSLYAQAAKFGTGTLGSENSIFLSTTDMNGADGFFDDKNDINHWRMTVGSNFGVTSDGVLYARDADISGSINAPRGSIGGWDITESGIARGFAKLLTDDRIADNSLVNDGVESAIRLAIGANNVLVEKVTEQSYEVWCDGGIGSKNFTFEDGVIKDIQVVSWEADGEGGQGWSPEVTILDDYNFTIVVTNFQVQTSADVTVDLCITYLTMGTAMSEDQYHFRVLDDGSLYASAIKIGTGALGSDSSVFLSTTDMAGTNGFFGGTSINNWRITMGSNFGVTSDGTLYANNANITGHLEVASGKIGDWDIIGGNIVGNYGSSNGCVVTLTPNHVTAIKDQDPSTLETMGWHDMISTLLVVQNNQTGLVKAATAFKNATPVETFTCAMSYGSKQYKLTFNKGILVGAEMQ